MTDSVPISSDADNEEVASQLCSRFDGLSSQEIIEAAILNQFAERITVVSSFAAESAVILHMVSKISPTTPIIFLNTGKHFGETLRYKDMLQSRLGLVDVRSMAPDPRDIENVDPQGTLAMSNSDECCRIRKVIPLERGLSNFDAWITGRKRFQSEARQDLKLAEWKNGMFKINPLANWGPDTVDDYIKEHNIPRHPLVRDGYMSIGCMPCTDRVAPGDDPRSGRWGGLTKSECGIHD